MQLVHYRMLEGTVIALYPTADSSSAVFFTYNEKYHRRLHHLLVFYTVYLDLVGLSSKITQRVRFQVQYSTSYCAYCTPGIDTHRVHTPGTHTRYTHQVQYCTYSCRRYFLRLTYFVRCRSGNTCLYYGWWHMKGAISLAVFVMFLDRRRHRSER